MAGFFNIHVNEVACERLSRSVRVVAAPKTPKPRQGNCGLEVALGAYVVPPLGLQASRIHDRRPYLLKDDFPAKRHPGMFCARPVAALAAEPLGQIFWKDLGCSIGIAPF